MDKPYTVGELAKEMHISIRTLQYYDRIELLKPSHYSEGGRRLYTDKDKLYLQQILSLKSLGFSLSDIKQRLFPVDTPQEVLDLLQQQILVLKNKITDYQLAVTTMEKMLIEIQKMGTVDFQKYADIISLIQNDNENYWIVNCFDSEIMDHVRTTFVNNESEALQIYETYQKVLDKAISLKESNVLADSKEAQLLAKEWWDMVMDFTKGDLSLIKNLENFNQQKDNWDSTLAKKQQLIDGYVGQILEVYLQKEQTDGKG